MSIKKVRAMLKKQFNFKPTFKSTKVHVPQTFDVPEEDTYREDELAFVIGLENTNLDT